MNEILCKDVSSLLLVFADGVEALIHRFPVSSLKKRKKFLGIEGEVVSCVSEIVLLFLNISETRS